MRWNFLECPAQSPDRPIRVREIFPACAILLLSGQAAAVDLMQRARAAGHDSDLLSKPIHPDQLLEWVARRMGHGPQGSS